VALTASHSLSLSIERDDWRDHASCRDTDPDLFFPVGTTGPAIEQIEQAKAVCRQCEVQTLCLEYALATNQDSGIWGGTSEEERRVLRRQRAARQRQRQSA
jgi:WhiB family redox-sensing transcriptional regulator